MTGRKSRVQQHLDLARELAGAEMAAAQSEQTVPAGQLPPSGARPLASLPRYEWERAVRDLPLRPALVKLVALMLATYSNKDGTNARPGEQRLATDCGVTDRAVRTHLKTLRRLGLLELPSNTMPNRRTGTADRYALVLPADLPALLDAFRSAQRRLRKEKSNEAEAALQIAADVLRAWVHRNGGSGGNDGTTGTEVPVNGGSPERGFQDHRNEGSKITGTRVPPTNTETNPSTNPSHAPASSTGREVVEAVVVDVPIGTEPMPTRSTPGPKSRQQAATDALFARAAERMGITIARRPGDDSREASA